MNRLLIDAAAHGNIEELRRLIAGGVDVNRQSNFGQLAIVAASFNGKWEAVIFLLDAGADPNIQENQTGWTALMQESIRNRGTLPNLVEVLLKRNAKPNLQDRNGSTALTRAAYNGHKDNVKLLLEYGADPNLRYGPGRTAFVDAASRGHRDIVEMFLKAESARGHSYDHEDLINAFENKQHCIVSLLTNYPKFQIFSRVEKRLPKDIHGLIYPYVVS